MLNVVNDKCLCELFIMKGGFCCSYGIGLVGVFVYICMFGNSVDSVGVSNVGGVMK